MKKRLALVLSLLMVFCLVGCSKVGELGKGNTPESIYATAAERMEDLKELDATVNMNMAMSQGEETMDMTMKMDMKLKDSDSENMKYFCDATISMLGMDVAMQMFYTDGYYYIDSFGQKMKCAMDYKEMLEKTQTTTVQIGDFSEFMKDIESKKEGNNTVISFVLDGEKMTDYIKEMMSDLGTGVEGDSYKGIEGTVETTINKDGYFTGAKLKLAFEMEIEGELMKIDMDMDMTYNNPGKAVSDIVLPDLDGYTEVDPSEMQ